MTVAELIETLKKFPPSMTVKLDGYDEYYKDIAEWNEQDYMCLDMLMMRKDLYERC